MQLQLRRSAAVLRRGRLDDGQDLLEYALLVSLVVIMAIGAVDLLGSTLKTVFWDAIAAADF